MYFCLAGLNRLPDDCRLIFYSDWLPVRIDLEREIGSSCISYDASVGQISLRSDMEVK
jgi:hypothetical protein